MARTYCRFRWLLCTMMVACGVSFNASGLSCPMGYRAQSSSTECVRIDGKSRFILSSEALVFYRQYVLPCEAVLATYPECGKYWYKFELMQRAQSLPNPGSKVDEKTSTDDPCEFGDKDCGSNGAINLPPTKPTNVGGGGSGGNRPTKTTTGKTDSSGKGGSAESGDEDSSSSSAQKGKKKKQVGEESYTGESTSCWTEDIGQVAGQPMCDANGSPSCYTKSAQKDSGLPKCGADGKPVASANEGNGGDQATGGAGDLPQGFPQPPEVEGDRALCEQAHKKAFTCCNDPVKCVSGLDGPSASSMTAMGTLLVGATGMIAMGGASGGDSAGIAKSCEFMKIVALGGAGANTALGGKCFTDKGSCEDKCTEVVNKYRRVLTECSNLDTVWSANGGQGRYLKMLCTERS